MIVAVPLKITQVELSFCGIAVFVRCLVRPVRPLCCWHPHNAKPYAASIILPSVPLFYLFFKSVIEVYNRAYRLGRSAALVAGETRVRNLPSRRNTGTAQRANTPEHAGCLA